MSLADGYTDVPPGKMAAVVTALEMTAPVARRPEPPRIDGELRRVEAPALDWYRDLYRRVGEEWLWFSRLRMTDEMLASIVHDPRVEVYALWQDGVAQGLLELDFRNADECEVAFLGLATAARGHGVGRWLMNRALEIAWARPIRRVWLHTCTLDHPSALAFYLRSGFTAYHRQIEIADDPRLTGIHPRTAAPHVPLIDR